MRPLNFKKMNGLIPAVVQHHRTGRVLMVGFINRAALKKIMSTGQLWFWSRSRKRLWQKGEISGHVHQVTKIMMDCDRDTLLISVQPHGPTCHTGKTSCFFTALKPIKKRIRRSSRPKSQIARGATLRRRGHS